MAIKPPKQRYSEISQPIRQAWNWVRLLPEYKADYEDMRKIRSRPYVNPPGHTLLAAPLVEDSCEELLTKRWGLYPLHNPKTTRAPVTFKMAFRGLFKIDGLLIQTELTHKHLVLKKRPLPSLPRRIRFDIDPRQQIGVQLAVVKDFLEHVQHVYKIKPGKPRAGRLFNRYQAHVLRKLGYSHGRILKQLMNNAGFTYPAPSNDIYNPDYESELECCKRDITTSKTLG